MTVFAEKFILLFRPNHWLGRCLKIQWKFYPEILIFIWTKFIPQKISSSRFHLGMDLIITRKLLSIRIFPRAFSIRVISWVRQWLNLFTMARKFFLPATWVIHHRRYCRTLRELPMWTI